MNALQDSIVKSCKDGLCDGVEPSLLYVLRVSRGHVFANGFVKDGKWRCKRP